MRVRCASSPVTILMYFLESCIISVEKIETFHLQTRAITYPAEI